MPIDWAVIGQTRFGVGGGRHRGEARITSRRTDRVFWLRLSEATEPCTSPATTCANHAPRQPVSWWGTHSRGGGAPGFVIQKAVLRQPEMVQLCPVELCRIAFREIRTLLVSYAGPWKKGISSSVEDDNVAFGCMPHSRRTKQKGDFTDGNEK